MGIFFGVLKFQIFVWVCIFFFFFGGGGGGGGGGKQ